MMILLFNVGGDSYGINVRDIVEVLPNVTLKHFPHGPEYVSGLLNYRGKTVPVVDLTLLMSSHVSRDRISSRIVLVNYQGGHDSRHYLLGLLIEKTTETVKISDHDLVSSGVVTKDTPFLGDVIIRDGSITQVIDTMKILPCAMQAVLFHDHQEDTVDVIGADD